MNRLWSLLFLLVPVLGVLLVVGAAANVVPLHQSWLPEQIGPRAAAVDGLFNLIHVIIGVVFALTGLVLAAALWKFGGGKAPARYVHSHLTLELFWTVIPAGILVFIALYQLPIWNQNKVDHPRTAITTEAGQSLQEPLLRVVARQFDWRFVYPGQDSLFDTGDDIVTFGEMMVPSGEPVVVELASEDVIHSFCINELRLKQDIVPGLAPRVWFEISRPGDWEIICTELCGWGHYRMTARIRARPEDEFDDWLRTRERDQFEYEADGD